MPQTPRADWLDFERAHVWHPYTGLPAPAAPLPVVSARGVRLRLADGRELIDGMASWWAAIHGYNHPALNRALEAQLARMAHVMFGGLTHPGAARLARELVEVTPAALETVFFCDSGSVAVEVAIKMALQYAWSAGHPERRRLLTVRGGYHGDTFGAMAVCDPENGMHHRFQGVLARHLFAPIPSCGADGEPTEEAIQGLQALLESHQDEVAAVILEPLVQGAGGMRFYCAAYLRAVRALCDRYETLLILDEIATGFGRTGHLFACQAAGVEPDILCLGKALTGGYMSLAATLTTRGVAEAISADGGALMHGPTFMANPLACAVASASLRLLLDSPWQARVARIETTLSRELEACRALPWVRDVRVLGAIGVVELQDPVDVARVQAGLVERGVWLRPFGRLVYAMPPYVIEEADLHILAGAMVEVLRHYGR